MPSHLEKKVKIINTGPNCFDSKKKKNLRASDY